MDRERKQQHHTTQTHTEQIVARARFWVRTSFAPARLALPHGSVGCGFVGLAYPKRTFGTGAERWLSCAFRPTSHRYQKGPRQAVLDRISRGDAITVPARAGLLLKLHAGSFVRCLVSSPPPKSQSQSSSPSCQPTRPSSFLFTHTTPQRYRDWQARGWRKMAWPQGLSRRSKVRGQKEYTLNLVPMDGRTGLVRPLGP